jgi:hypothetical protein
MNHRWQVEFLAKVALSFPPEALVGPVANRDPDEMPPTNDSRLYIRFRLIQQRGLNTRITSFGRCFAFRLQRTGNKLSTHGWGIAIDLNPETNLQGAVGDRDAVVIEIFRRAGLEWGGDWRAKTRDPMHFQFCTGH